jgi:hypothetical protein
MRWCGSWSLAAALALAVSGCSGNSVDVATSAAPTAPAAAPAGPIPGPATSAPAPAASTAPQPQPSLKDKIANFFSSKSANAPQPVANAQQDADCPYIDIRQGASTLTIPPPPIDGSNEAMTLKYQGTFTRAARDCKVVAGQMMMNIGVQGRIVVGPAGGAGQVDVPLRIAVVTSPATGSRMITTKLVLIPVNVPDQNGAGFTHIEDGLTFPMPSASELSTYIVYIGFDPIGAAAEEQRNHPAPRAKPKPKSKPNPSAPTG